MPDSLYPDPAAPRRLLADMTDFFTSIHGVNELLVFGSLATNNADRWSDIDLIVATDTSAQFRAVFDQLCQHRTIRYHSPFTLTADGAAVLGNVFADESIFHVLDLNFLTGAERLLPGALDRFGAYRTLYHSDHRPESTADDRALTGDPLDPEEEHIFIAIHFTKKALKRLLRGDGDPEALRQNLNRLDTVLQPYPADFTTPNGEMGYVAQTYRELANHTLARMGSSHSR